jgi:hypothetical protein
MRHVTSKDIPMSLWGSPVVIPKGTEVILVKGASGIEGDLWAIKSERLLMDLTGNTHDPKYRYVFVKREDIEAA